MKTTSPVLSDLIDVLKSGNAKFLRITLPGGETVPSHFHVTEVGRVRKDFIDCGGTVRQTAQCQLQLLVATDYEHRLAPSKLLTIIEKSQPVLGESPLPLTVEYGQEIAVVYPATALELVDGVLELTLETPMTACLAADRCGLSHEEARTPGVFDVLGCAPGSECC